jgi:hypothetical protein
MEMTLTGLLGACMVGASSRYVGAAEGNEKQPSSRVRCSRSQRGVPNGSWDSHYFRITLPCAVRLLRARARRFLLEPSLSGT